ncbi:MAG: DUF2652 domain-containing protein [Chloroflexota bacterium]
MVTAITRPHADTGLLLLADISGYTAFLGKVATEHPDMVQPGGQVPPAYVVMSSLLDMVVDRIAPAFHLCEIEGDAVFAYAADDPGLVQGEQDLMALVRSAYAGFRERIDEAMVVHKHECRACFLLPSLELKFVVHHGNFVIQPIAGQTKLLGPTVNVAHRLLKNSVTQQMGSRAYLLVTDAAAGRLHFRPDTGLAHEENYPDVGTVAGRVIGLAEPPGDVP